jgi:hypothetical protein
MPFCGQCGKQAPEQDRFCAGCGASLRAPAPLEFDAHVEAKLSHLTRVESAKPAVAEAPVVHEGPVLNEGPEWIPAWLNALSYKKLLWGAGVGVVISVIADVLRTFGEGWLTSSREFRDGVWIVHDNFLYSVGETAQNVAVFSKVLGVLLAFVALVLILLRAMRKTLLAH